MSHYWYCPNCKLGNSSNYGFCGSCGAPKPAAGLINHTLRDLVLVGLVLFGGGGLCGGGFVFAIISGARSPAPEQPRALYGTPAPLAPTTVLNVSTPSPTPVAIARPKRTPLPPPTPEPAVEDYLSDVSPTPEPYRYVPPRSVEPSQRSLDRGYITGPRGGCYYINSRGNKTYVDRSMCN